METTKAKSINSENTLSGKNVECKCCGCRNTNFIGQKRGYKFWECSVCSFVFTDGVSYKDMVEAYSSGYHSVEEGAPNNGWAKSADFLQPALRLLRGKPLKMLDFGCGESRIPDALRNMGHSVTGVDIVPPVNPHPDRLTGDILDLHLPAGSYDIIYSYQVFEHIAEPLPVIRELLRLLRSDGVLLIHTDMETKERKSGFLNWWYVLPPDHCSYYRPVTFEKIVENMPAEVIFKGEKVVMIRRG